jgi:hypothetical protein
MVLMSENDSTAKHTKICAVLHCACLADATIVSCVREHSAMLQRGYHQVDPGECNKRTTEQLKHPVNGPRGEPTGRSLCPTYWHHKLVGHVNINASNFCNLHVSHVTQARCRLQLYQENTPRKAHRVQGENPVILYLTKLSSG